MVFSRRSIQKCLCGLETALAPGAHSDLIARLEKPGGGRLAAMWEAVWLYALNSEIHIEHERPLINGSRPDFRFVIQEPTKTIEVVGDITSVSDKGVHDNNPVQHFWDGIVRLVRKHKLNPNHFSYNISHRMMGDYGDQRAVLLLPSRKLMQSYLKHYVEPFIIGIAATKPEKYSRKFESDGVDFILDYNILRDFSGGGHIVYNIPYSPTKNPIYTALERKADQLSGAPDNSVRVVILCDADCNALQSTKLDSPGTLSAAQVVQNFLKSSGTLDAILLVTTEPIDRFNYFNRDLRISAQWVARHPGTRLMKPETLQSVRNILSSALNNLPAPMLDPHNARIRSKITGYGHGTLGMKRSDKRIQISARQVLELLAGSVSQEQFLKSYGWDGNIENSRNPFLIALAQGKMINGASISSGGDADDDWLEFTFSDPDPAISAFMRSFKPQK